MTAPIHILVRGTPVSFRANRQAVQEWRQKVAAAARARVQRLTAYGELAVSITHFYRTLPRCDADNMSKLICDALSNIVYRDDHQLMECICRRVPLTRGFMLPGMPRELAIALCEGDEFVFIRVTKAQSESWSLFQARTALLWS